MNGLFVATIVVAPCLALGCGGRTALQPDATAFTAQPPPSAPSCEVRGGGGGPVTDPNGPFFHQVAVARSTDGVNISEPREVLQHASVPDGVRLADRRVLIYYVNGAEGAVWVARFDGVTATPIGPIAINGVTSPQGVVDPDATLLADGRIRLAYLNGFGSPGGSSRAVCLADSENGVSFTVTGAAILLNDSSTTDPSMTRLADGTWLMAMSRGQTTVMSRSSDGLTFQPYDTLTFGGVPEVATLADGRVRLYVCSDGIVSYGSRDQGRSWTREATVVPRNTLGRRIICDPSWVTGAEWFIFKTAN